MCSQYEDPSFQLENLKLKNAVVSVGSQCRKCEEKAQIVLRKKDPLCSACFCSYVTHKFRSTLGKSRIMKPRDKILIAYSGGQASAAMLHFVTEGQNEIARKKVILQPLLLYIEEPVFQDGDYKSSNDSILSHLQSSQFPAYHVKIQHILNKDFGLGDIQEISKTNHALSTDSIEARKDLDDKYRNLISSIKTFSAKEDFIQRVKMNLMVKCANLLECPKVFLGDTANRLAVRIISGLALGRGGQMSYDMGFTDNRHEDVLIIRPMRELMSKEVAFYNSVNNIPHENIPEITTKANFNSSIQRLTEEFVLGLQEDFPATISTVFRTGDKILTNVSRTKNICVICKSTLEIMDESQSSAMAALNVSANLETLFKDKSNISSLDSSCCGDCSCSSTKSKYESLCAQLCYACKITVKSFADASLIPDEIIAEAKTTNNRAKMKEMIADYLIEDDN